LSAIPDELGERRGELIEAISTDMGKPVKRAEIEVSRTIDSMQYFLSHAEEWLAPEPRECGTVVYEPLGVAIAITPWNFPLAIPMFQCIPSLIAGNVVVFKPSEFGVRSGRIFAEACAKYLPTDTLSCVIGGRSHGEEMLKEPVDFLSFTGSTSTGARISQVVSQNFTRLQLELGGMDAALVMGDVSPSEVAPKIVELNAANSGQVCCSVKRVYVERGIYHDFIEAAVKASKEVVVGDPRDPATQMGPLTSESQLLKCERYVEDARARGAVVRTGGARVPRDGFFYPHTVVTDIPADALLFHEEAFAPILPILPVSDMDEAVRLANSSKYALSASVWGNDLARAKSLACALEAGVIGINRHGVPPTGCPWGGAKHSGLGRGRSREGLIENCNLKFVY
jgi:acyl-CoA reductase-like NAD-dependent aldehyde dehydrogenase